MLKCGHGRKRPLDIFIDMIIVNINKRNGSIPAVTHGYLWDHVIIHVVANVRLQKKNRVSRSVMRPFSF